jgi:hypothetical protein
VTKSSDQVNGSADGDDVGNVGNDAGNVVGAKVLSATGRPVFDAIQITPIAIAIEMANAIGKSERQAERARASLRDADLM